MKNIIENTLYLLKFTLEVLSDNDLQETKNHDNWVIGRDIESNIKELEKAPILSERSIILNDEEGEVIGTVILLIDVSFQDIVSAWDKYIHIRDIEDLDIHEFVGLNPQLCRSLNVEFYQP